MKTIFFAFIICGIMACNGQQQANEAETTQDAVEQPAAEPEVTPPAQEPVMDTVPPADSTVVPQ